VDLLNSHSPKTPISWHAYGGTRNFDLLKNTTVNIRGNCATINPPKTAKPIGTIAAPTPSGSSWATAIIRKPRRNHIAKNGAATALAEPRLTLSVLGSQGAGKDAIPAIFGSRHARGSTYNDTTQTIPPKPTARISATDTHFSTGTVQIEAT
jgi:hypothetical protein